MASTVAEGSTGERARRVHAAGPGTAWDGATRPIALRQVRGAGASARLPLPPVRLRRGRRARGGSCRPRQLEERGARGGVALLRGAVGVDRDDLHGHRRPAPRAGGLVEELGGRLAGGLGLDALRAPLLVGGHAGGHARGCRRGRGRSPCRADRASGRPCAARRRRTARRRRRASRAPRPARSSARSRASPASSGAASAAGACAWGCVARRRCRMPAAEPGRTHDLQALPESRRNLRTLRHAV